MPTAEEVELELQELEREVALRRQQESSSDPELDQIIREVEEKYPNLKR